MVCEADEPMEEENDPVASDGKCGHGHCGHILPQIRKEGRPEASLMYKKPRVEENRVITVLSGGVGPILTLPAIGWEVPSPMTRRPSWIRSVPRGVLL